MRASGGSCAAAAPGYAAAMLSGDEYDLTSGAGLMACPRCDALHIGHAPEPGETLRCIRCGTVLASPRGGAFARVVALSLAVLALMAAAMFLPFLRISRFGFGNETSLFDVALAFSQGALLPLAVLVLAFIIGLPVLRALLLIYTLLPLASGRRPFPGARAAFRLSEALRPWSMAEIFVIGTAVALVKVAGLAHVGLGPAFWAFCGLMVANAAGDALTCAATVWNALDPQDAPLPGPTG